MGMAHILQMKNATVVCPLHEYTKSITVIVVYFDYNCEDDEFYGMTCCAALKIRLSSTGRVNRN